MLRGLARDGTPRTAARAWVLVAEICVERSDLGGAETAYRAAIDTGDDVTGATAALNLGNLLHQEGRVPEAETMLTTAMESGHPEAGPKAACSLGSLLARGGRGVTAADHPSRPRGSVPPG
jgi:predicted negative regulator of RcsB-dependent stress response